MAEHVHAERGELRDGAAVKFQQVELDSWRLIHAHLSVTTNSAVKNCSTETWTNFKD